MEDLTEKIRSALPDLLKGVLLTRNQMWGEENHMSIRTFGFSTISEMINYLEEPAYVYLPEVRFRDPFYSKEITGDSRSFKRNELLLQDRCGSVWIRAIDGTILKRMRNSFSDYDILEKISGKINAEKHFTIIGYKGRISMPSSETGKSPIYSPECIGSLITP